MAGSRKSTSPRATDRGSRSASRTRHPVTRWSPPRPARLPAFKLADVRSAYDALPVAYRPTASWVFSPSAFSSLAGLTDTAGALVLPTLHANEPSLFGRPVYVSPDFPAAAANARSAFFGDLSLAYVVRRIRAEGQRRPELRAGLLGPLRPSSPDAGRPACRARALSPRQLQSPMLSADPPIILRSQRERRPSRPVAPFPLP